MKSEYDFSEGERGKFSRSSARLNTPVHLDPETRRMVEKFARKNKMEFDAAVNELLLRALPKTPAESFRQGWKEIMKGDTLPIAELWKDIEE